MNDVVSSSDTKPPLLLAEDTLLPKRVAILYSDVKRENFVSEEQYLTEKDALKDAQLVADYLEKMHIKAFLIPGNPDMPAALKKLKPDMAINMVSNVKGSDYLAATIPALLELLEIPYTGSSILGESLTYNKFLVKQILASRGVPVPGFQLMTSATDYLDPTLRFPLISKLNEIHGAVEINKDAISENEKHLRTRVAELIKTYKQPILVEEFIVGREITAVLFDGLNTKVYMAEKVFDALEKYNIASFDNQWKEDWGAFHYQIYKDPLLKEYVKKAFESTKMSDYAKFDIRMDQSGRYYFIDSNSNPAFGPKEADVALALIMDMYDIDFPEILRRLMRNTLDEVTAAVLPTQG